MTKPFATVLEPATSLKNKTGSWKTMRPEYVDRIPPCNLTCPAGENIQKWLSLAQEEKFKEAWEVITKDNPFPAVMGRVCYHTCEKTCNRGQFDGSVNINLIERSIGDIAIKNGWAFEQTANSTKKRVLIIGAGPSGLTAAYFLKKMGHDVTILEGHEKAGGMMRYGVPRFRLPSNVMDAEISRIINMGINLVCNKKINHISEVINDFDATYLAIGAYKAAKVDVEVRNNAYVIDAIDMLQKIETDVKSMPNLGKRVVVYGGGNTSIDVARTALRLGAENVKIVYRRTINNMSAHDTEIQDALSEGIEILCLRTISVVDNKSVFINKMNYDEENDILSASNETEELQADSVVFAIGQSVNSDILTSVDGLVISDKGVVEVNKNMMTGVAGIFAGGDVIPCKRTVTNAIGHGKKAAKCIDAYLRNEEFVAQKKHEVVNFKKLNTAYFKNNARNEISRLGDISFDEKDVSLSKDEIILESNRCFSCGNCFHCDNCYGYCPDNAVIKHPDGTLEFNYDYCKGCGICESECPCGAIKMSSEKK